VNFNDNFGEMIMLTETITKQEFSSPGAECSNGNKRGAAPHSLTDRQEASDEALIKSLAKGDKHAFQVLFARHNMRVFRFALRFVRDESLAEDLVSEVFLEAWRHAGKFEERSRVSTWLLAIARNKAINLLRRCSDVELNEEMATRIEDPSDDPAVTIEKNDRSAILWICLTQLSPTHREVIHLVYYHEKSVGEVAHIMGTPESTVKTRMFYARNQIENLLKKAGVDRAC
jgi:RNA polymerase sigma-70 factor (ECF subfamily)